MEEEKAGPLKKQTHLRKYYGGIKVNGVPSLIIPGDIYQRPIVWADTVDGIIEVSWRGLTDWNQEKIEVTEIYLPKNISSVGHVNVPTAVNGGDMSIWLSDCFRRGVYLNKGGDVRFKFHMHSHPGTSWNCLNGSGEDRMTTNKYGEKDIDWMLFGRSSEDGKRYAVELEIFQPDRFSVFGIPVYADFNGALVLVSEPDISPSLDGEYKVSWNPKAEDLQMIRENHVYYGELEKLESETPKAQLKLGSFGYSRCLNKYRIINVSEDVLPINTLQYAFTKKNGLLRGRILVSSTPWKIETDEISVQLDVQINKDVIRLATQEAKGKIIKEAFPLGGERILEAHLKNLDRKKGGHDEYSQRQIF